MTERNKPASHTPGPWAVPCFANPENACTCKSVLAQHQTGMGSIAQVSYGGDGDEPLPIAIANAHLIASAPELLDALVLALPYVEDAQQDPCYKPGAVAKVIAEMRAAIAKATGATS